MTFLSAALSQELPRLSISARVRALDVVEPNRLLGLTVLHVWRFMLVLGLAVAIFGAGGAPAGAPDDLSPTPSSHPAHAQGPAFGHLRP
jgi:hypothetical protein